MTNSIALDSLNFQAVFNHIASYLNKRDLQALAVTCQSLHKKCYDDKVLPLIPISLAKDSLDRFYPGYAAFKPRNMTYNQFYRQLQTINGIFYAIKKGYWDGELKDLKLSEKFIKAVGP